MKYVMKKKYNNPATEILTVHNLPIEMDTSIESSSASKISEIKVGGDNFGSKAPKTI